MTDTSDLTFCSIIADLIPSLFVAFYLGFTYYVYVKEIYLKSPDVDKTYIYLAVFHFLLIMTFWCFIKLMVSDIPLVPKRFGISSELFERILTAETNEVKHRLLVGYCKTRQLNVHTRTTNGYIRFCKYCSHVKPDRTHHCSSCETCVLRRDHHCPWVNNCICLTNHKTFILLLFYVSSYLMFILLTSADTFLVSWKSTEKTRHDIQVLILFSSVCVVGMIMIPFFSYHVYLLLTNTTTLEKISPPNFEDEEASFDLGPCDNFVQVFGNSCFTCCLPIEKTTCDGVNFDLS